jgi:carboxymethylenebutenolidase
MIDSHVQIRTADGLCDAALIHPEGEGRWPAVIWYVDAFGLRPAMRDMAKRLAHDGYTVLIPNPYYRSTRAPGVPPGANLSNPDDRKKIMDLRSLLTAEALTRDVAAFVAFLDSQAAVKKQAKLGTVGYCMGGSMTMRAAAALPNRVGAGASFHGGALVTDKPDSPHLLVPKIKARYYFGVAANDDANDPAAKTTLKRAFETSGGIAKIEVYEGCMHGWCVKDMPIPSDGKAIYNQAQAERAWTELLGLFKRDVI